MTTDEFRATLKRLGLSQGALSRILLHLGDPAEPITVRRRVERWAQGGHRIPGEAIALLTLLDQHADILDELQLVVSTKREIQ
jgi:DNA-binding transcriptional regulator YiaG